jgi:hypothetical protein
MATDIASRKHKSLAQNEARWGKERCMETNNLTEHNNKLYRKGLLIFFGQWVEYLIQPFRIMTRPLLCPCDTSTGQDLYSCGL